MTDINSQVVSFANSYFTLADGLATGLEDYLADNVILVWFDKTIKGKRSVNTFLNYHKVNSRHIFNDITPTDTIDYKKRKPNRKHNRSSDSNESKNSNSSSENIDNSMHATDNEGNLIKEEGTSYELSYGDLNELFKLDIAPTIASEIEDSIEKIKQLKVEENMNATEEHGLSNRFAKAIQVEGIKFLRANGELRLWKKRKGGNVYDSVATSASVWRRSCNLQIAYSLIKSKAQVPNINVKNNTKSSGFKFQNSGLLSFEEISELSNHLVPNVNDFGGYLRNTNFREDRDNFLKSFGEEIAKTESEHHHYIPEYVGNKLVFRKTNITDCEESNDFVFNYQIHMIIYKGERIKKQNSSKDSVKETIEEPIEESVEMVEDLVKME
ncbi:uncharacterized protein LOC122508799 [Leptopilina heterotoma]|uniref:uncharacterized protein LOC122508799 n=1 Tax=Leptopilina heterotoma TaxID=63436 RepID=UPI001CA84D82|nr:uncharacterized protein LOC122508799 [Leptopilina heterotoma]XP_043478288.1 uncharacterized protein LOC122508799 [Leptopilina heterotoma]